MQVRWSAALALGLVGCLEFSPHALPMDESERDLHQKALERLRSQPAPQVLRFAVVGDTQRYFDHAEDAVESINRRDDLSFVVQMGDFVNFGLLPEYQAMNRVFRRLDVPYFVVVGVHDLFANGGDIYRAMFGPYDLSFTYGRTRFVLYNANSLQFGNDGTVPDLPWLAAQIAPRPEHDDVIVFAHVDPDALELDASLREPLHDMFRNTVDLRIHAHAHKLVMSEVDGVPFVVADSVDHRSYLVVTVGPGMRPEVEKVDF
jgi:3',5'-cyclic AMP phosphodiesterase CpdA